MSTYTSDIFSTVPKHNYLNLRDHLEEVPKFLDLDKSDVSKAADISKASVRYDERIPKELERLLYELATICELVAEYFDGDAKKNHPLVQS